MLKSGLFHPSFWTISLSNSVTGVDTICWLSTKAKQFTSKAKIANHLLAGCYHQNLLIEPTVLKSILAIFTMCLCTWDPCFELPAKLLCLLLRLPCWNNTSKSWAK